MDMANAFVDLGALHQTFESTGTMVFGVRVPTPFSGKQIETADDAVASREEVEEQVERKRVEKEAFENGISASSAEKWIRNGSIRG